MKREITASPAQVTEDLKVEELAELETEVENFFQYLNCVGDLKKTSLTEVLDIAIGEEEKLRAWRKSGKPARNVRAFYRRSGKLQPLAKSYRSKWSNFFKNGFEITSPAGGQFEIWCCDDQHKPDFPVRRLAISAIDEKEPLLIEEKLSKNYFLRIQAKKNRRSVFVTFKIEKELVGKSSIAGICSLLFSSDKRLSILLPEVILSGLLLMMFFTLVYRSLPVRVKENEARAATVIPANETKAPVPNSPAAPTAVNNLAEVRKKHQFISKPEQEHSSKASRTVKFKEKSGPPKIDGQILQTKATPLDEVSPTVKRAEKPRRNISYERNANFGYINRRFSSANSTCMTNKNFYRFGYRPVDETPNGAASPALIKQSQDECRPAI